MTNPNDTTPEAIAALLDGVSPGPWEWQVNRSTMTVELSGGKQTKAGGDLTVMSFARYGMHGASPVFWTWDGFTATRVDRADKLAIAVPGREHHANWFARIDHPDARFIAAARELVPALAAEIARLTAERDEWQRQAIYHNRKHGEMLTAFRAAEAERDEARAQVAMAYEAAAVLLDPEKERPTDYDRNKKTAYDAGYYDARKSDAAVVRALTPADATAALAARDAAMRNEGRRQAAEIAATYCFARTTNSGALKSPAVFTSHTWQDIRDTILAALEPEGGE